MHGQGGSKLVPEGRIWPSGSLMAGDDAEAEGAQLGTPVPPEAAGAR